MLHRHRTTTFEAVHAIEMVCSHDKHTKPRLRDVCLTYASGVKAHQSEPWSAQDTSTPSSLTAMQLTNPEPKPSFPEQERTRASRCLRRTRGRRPR